MKFYSTVFILIFLAFLLAPPVISFFEIENDTSDISFFEEENPNNNNYKIGFDWDFIIRSNLVFLVELSDKKVHFSWNFNNDKFCVYLKPKVPPPQIS